MTQYTLAEAVAERSVFAHLVVTSQTDTTASLLRKRNPRNGINFLLTLFTLGLWAPIWLLNALMVKDDHEVLRVDNNGIVQHTWKTWYGRTLTQPYKGRTVRSALVAFSPN